MTQFEAGNDGRGASGEDTAQKNNPRGVVSWPLAPGVSSDDADASRPILHYGTGVSWGAFLAIGHTVTVDDPRFEITGGRLHLRPGATLDAATEPEVTLTLTATDKGGRSTTGRLTLPVDDPNETPNEAPNGSAPDHAAPPAETPEAPQTPDTPHAPDAPDHADHADPPAETAEIPDMPETRDPVGPADAADPAGTPDETPDDPPDETPETPETPDTPDHADVPGPADVPDPSDTPDPPVPPVPPASGGEDGADPGPVAVDDPNETPNGSAPDPAAPPAETAETPDTPHAPDAPDHADHADPPAETAEIPDMPETRDPVGPANAADPAGTPDETLDDPPDETPETPETPDTPDHADVPGPADVPDPSDTPDPPVPPVPPASGGEDGADPGPVAVDDPNETPNGSAPDPAAPPAETAETPDTPHAPDAPDHADHADPPAETAEIPDMPETRDPVGPANAADPAGTPDETPDDPPDETPETPETPDTPDHADVPGPADVPDPSDTPDPPVPPVPPASGGEDGADPGPVAVDDPNETPNGSAPDPAAPPAETAETPDTPHAPDAPDHADHADPPAETAEIPDMPETRDPVGPADAADPAGTPDETPDDPPDETPETPETPDTPDHADVPGPADVPDPSDTPDPPVPPVPPASGGEDGADPGPVAVDDPNETPNGSAPDPAAPPAETAETPDTPHAPDAPDHADHADPPAETAEIPDMPETRDPVGPANAADPAGTPDETPDDPPDETPETPETPDTPDHADVPGPADVPDPSDTPDPPVPPVPPASGGEDGADPGPVAVDDPNETPNGSAPDPAAPPAETAETPDTPHAPDAPDHADHADPPAETAEIPDMPETRDPVGPANAADPAGTPDETPDDPPDETPETPETPDTPDHADVPGPADVPDPSDTPDPPVPPVPPASGGEDGADPGPVAVDDPNETPNGSAPDPAAPPAETAETPDTPHAPDAPDHADHADPPAETAEIPDMPETRDPVGPANAADPAGTPDETPDDPPDETPETPDTPDHADVPGPADVPDPSDTPDPPVPPVPPASGGEDGADPGPVAVDDPNETPNGSAPDPAAPPAETAETPDTPHAPDAPDHADHADPPAETAEIPDMPETRDPVGPANAADPAGTPDETPDDPPDETPETPDTPDHADVPGPADVPDPSDTPDPPVPPVPPASGGEDGADPGPVAVDDPNETPNGSAPDPAAPPAETAETPDTPHAPDAPDHADHADPPAETAEIPDMPETRDPVGPANAADPAGTPDETPDDPPDETPETPDTPDHADVPGPADVPDPSDTPDPPVPPVPPASGGEDGADPGPVAVDDPNETPNGSAFAHAPHFGETATLNVRLGGEAYLGDPAYEIYVDGEKVASGQVTWARETTEDGYYETVGGNGDVDNDAVAWRDIAVDVRVPSGGFGAVEVRFPNDAYRQGVGDRNLIVDFIEIDGHRIEAESEHVTYRGAKGSYDAETGAERMPWKGSLVFDAAPVFADATFGDTAPATFRVAENDASAFIGRVTATDPDAGDTITLGVSDDRFEIVGDKLKLKDGVALDHEAASSVDVDVTATDSGGLSRTQTLRVDVGDVNEAPEDLMVASSGMPEDDLVLWLEGQDRDGDFAPDASGSDSNRAWVDKSGKGSTGTISGDAPMVTDTGLDFAATTAGYRISGNADLNRGTFPEKSFAFSFEVGEDVSGVQMIYEQGGSVRGYSLSIAPDPETGDPTLWGLAYNRSEWESGHRHKPVNLGPAEPGRFYNVALVHDATSPEPDSRTFSGYVDGELVDTATRVNVQYNHPDPAGVGNVNNDTVLAHTARPFSGSIPFKGTISEVMSWNRALTVDEVSDLDGHFTINQSQVADGVYVFETAEVGDVVATLSARDPDAGDSLTYRVVDADGQPVDDPRFVIDGTAIRLKLGAALDHETAASHDLRVQVTDAGGLSRTETLSIRVLDVDEAPVDIRLDATEVVDTIAGGTIVATITATDPEGGAIAGYEIVGAADRRIDHATFEIVGDKIQLRDGATLDADLNGSFDLRLQAIDAGGNVAYSNVTITVLDGNRAPTAISLADSVVRGDAVGARVGRLAVADDDAGDSHAFTVSDARFEVVDGVLGLRAGVALDPDRDDIVSVDVTATDRFGESVTETFAIDVADALQVQVSTGFRAEYFNRSERVKSVNDIDWTIRPDHAALTQTIEYENNSGSFWQGGDTDTFAARITGRVDVPEAGAYTFHMGADDGAVLFINGAKVIDHDGDHGYSTKSGEVTLQPGAHDIEIRYFENFGVAGLKLEWEGPGIAARQPVQASDALNIDENGMIAIAIRLDDGPAPEAGGFTARYYDFDTRVERLAQIDWDATPDHTASVDTIDYQNGDGSFWERGATDTFAARLDGRISVTEGGVYDFHLGADDGAMLYVNGQPVIDNDGDHGFRTRSTQLRLDPGTHEIEVRYFENYGKAGLKLEWEGPDTNGRQLVTAVDAPPPADTETPGAAARLDLTGLPADTILISGDIVVVTDGGPVDVSDWDLSLLEVAPPPGFQGQIDWGLRQTSGTGETREIALSDRFPLTVGDPEAGAGPGSEPAADDPGDPRSVDPGWAEDDPDAAARSGSGDDGGAQDDDVMAEEVAMAGGEDNAPEMTDTYERHDW